VFFIGALTLLWALTSIPEDDRSLQPSGSVTLVVVAGQSNATSRAPDGDASLAAPVSGIYQIARTGKGIEPVVVAAEPLQHWDVTPQGIGFGFAFAKHYKAHHPDRDIIIIPAAKGETGLGPEEWGAGGNLNTDLVARVNSIAARYEIDQCAFLWHQGENEVVAGSDAYGHDIAVSFSAMKAGAPTLRSCTFLVGGLADSFVADHKGETVTAALRSIPETIFVDASGLRTMDGVHFTAAAQIEFGRRFFEAYASTEAGR